ncbi:MAG: ATP-dependent RecD-like DNA helicase [Clostridium sp.]|jgi:exodeoxyribonuclease V alpha subunit|uniref:SF1B family DNA helicase RecD2 n=1 Tax=Clostridium sp. TaxID=1506 RepID=UPI0025C31B45|nr:ATP-dependent RecD-like DNA helicase [Clostridium sp.]MCH3965276.1 ATP-dependent RecD-like DNA helicase [Clostridium sp.]MCI1714497.1 ATP-dependent RecD-like DNA helicase [Clostridium sp.]MCI1798759.1 ATP-dependent RecD-like DNA helicase [Clostridium sp.]MCI1812510.1 ATP-dependent RecD-like DNA helicase [Clostridium sp.]MCI1869569.1 ATP-dependent RecD-like DNA helicase [Clostridium sp.]
MQEIQGIIDDIVFQNEDNGYVVAKLKNKSGVVTIVGNVPFIMEGQNLKFMGEWVTHPHFGQQFKIKYSEEIIPDTKVGIERYLSSGAISGIGPVTAKKIVDKFGDKTLDIMDNHIERLREIEGIGEKKINLICESYSKQSEVRNIMIFLQTYGISANQCVKIHKRFGADSIKTVKENPYVLTDEISGIGFKIADRIARSLGIEANSPFRIQSGIKYIVSRFCNFGNTYMPLKKLVEESEGVLNVTREEIEENIYDSSLKGKLKLEKSKDEICVFLPTYYYCELSVTKKILYLQFNKYDEINIDIEKEITNFEALNNIQFAESQKDAIRGAFQNGVEIITGGPGTGKTTIINCIADIFEKLNMKVLMAAPTGRAAKRMSESTGRESKTIHRLLEMGVPRDEEALFFSKSEETPLECDVVIIDEASMIDIMLMNNLLKAISIGTRIIIVGDSDQLPSVGPGNVLRDFIDSKCIKVIRLKEIFRQSKESMIIVNAHRINSGEMPFINKKDRDFYFIECTDPNKILDTLIELVNTRLPRFNKSWNKLNHIQVVSPMRKGLLGVSNLNKKLQNILNPESSDRKQREFRDTIFRVGDKVMQTKNDYSLNWTLLSDKEEKGLGIFNGDVGYIEDIDNENNNITVIFDDDKRVIYDNIYLDEIELAYAITIHKSQGSEFPVIIMPVFMGSNFFMNRNLLYTAITRAKQMVVLVGDLKALKFMIDNNRSFERYSLLKNRIMDIMESEEDVTLGKDEFPGREK